MSFLIDTQLALRAKFSPDRLSMAARDLIDDPDEIIFFSVIALWETVIKSALGRGDFAYEATALRRSLLDTGFRELGIAAAHVLAVANLPAIHADPFDRLLLAQARSEGLTLLTTDAALARYGSPVRRV